MNRPNEQSDSCLLSLPDFVVVLLIGVSGSGKSTFAARHFRPSEILSSDAFRLMVSDDENNQAATKDAFDALHAIAEIRLRNRKSVVVDATNVQPEARKPLLELAHRHDCLAVAIVLDVPDRVCQERNRARADRQFGPQVVLNQSRQLRQSLRNLKREGFRYQFSLNESQIEQARVVRVPLWTDRRDEVGPFDLIGDVHGCYNEMIELLGILGYSEDSNSGVWQHAAGRRAVFLGDLVDRGPKVVETVELVQAMTAAGSALCVPGNHDTKLMRVLKGSTASITHGLAESLKQIEALPDEKREAFKKKYITFIDALVSHLWLDGGRLCAAHAGMKEAYIGRASGRVREFALYGETTGETDEFGMPIRYLWAQDYRGSTTVVYGHTPVPEAEWLNNTINLDTGCVFGGKLTALRWPERELVQVPAKSLYAESSRPFQSALQDTVEEMPFIQNAQHPIPNTHSAQWQHDELLRAEDVLGKRIIEARLKSNVIIPAENAGAALEVMSRFAVEPRWLIYLPPTMSPCETAPDGDVLEHPLQAFDYFRAQGVVRVVCQKKHMGSRAVVVVCRDAASARRRFGAVGESIGQCFTRTGRQFFDDEAMHMGLLQEAANAMTRAGLWEALETDWICLDCELMPWNAKAQGLLRDQYAPVAAAARLALDQAIAASEAAIARGVNLGPLRDSLRQRHEDVQRYTAAYGHYCWEVNGLEEIRLAPFHLLATEGRTYFDRTHDWHIQTLSHLDRHSSLFHETDARQVEIGDETSEAEGTAWWQTLTDAGGEGMVVKPLEFVVRGPKGLVQPAIKVRGREYLRIIYGPEYTEPANMERLRSRRLSTKRSLALREFALGVEGLERFVRNEPLRRVHECVFGVLALESEPVDPRL